MRNLLFIILHVLLMGITEVFAQATDSVKFIGAREDTIYVRENFAAASAKLATANILPFSVDYFIRKESWSYISGQSIANNLRFSSWEWDRDKFLNNQFSHSYHGSYYFNAFRSEGYGFWQAAPATFAGSLLWEIAGENERPAINDLINTTLGGMAWGEMTHKLAMRFTHNWRTGRRKNVLDVIGIAIDPMNGFSTLLSKKKATGTKECF
ncbi:MAG TPA: DUF3943 domain-containing protein [Flavisolibacter sp.]|nr:DUF3943 domain-containing protein [Flavisolibacter sp.]